MDQQQRRPETTRLPNVAHVPLGRIDDATSRTVLQRILGGKPVPVAAFQSAL